MSFPFCWSSGELGPKRKQGDYQIPKGFYKIDRFNPESNFHLSLGINYPNTADRILSNANKLGGDIYIYGSCFSIGCIPITNDYIEELYILAVEATNNDQLEIPVHIFPAKLSEKNYQKLIDENDLETNNYQFWLNLKEGYDYFENTQQLPVIEINDSEKYIFKYVYSDNCQEQKMKQKIEWIKKKLNRLKNWIAISVSKKIKGSLHHKYRLLIDYNNEQKELHQYITGPTTSS